MYANLIVESKNRECDVSQCGKEGSEDRDDQLDQQVTIDRQGITSRDWESYPILRFPGTPKIETVLINRPGMPFLGSGEAAQGPTPAAIANAIYDAVGIRLREIPFTPERVRAALNRY